MQLLLCGILEKKQGHFPTRAAHLGRCKVLTGYLLMLKPGCRLGVLVLSAQLAALLHSRDTACLSRVR